MLSDENDSFLRYYRVKDDMTLLDLHACICRDLDYDEANMSSFFGSDGEWARIGEYTLIDMGVDENSSLQTMDKVEVGRLLQRAGDRLIYQFDMIGDRCYYLEVAAVGAFDASEKLPSTVESSGDPVDQFAFDAESNQSIFDQMMGDFADFEGDDTYDDPV